MSEKTIHTVPTKNVEPLNHDFVSSALKEWREASVDAELITETQTTDDALTELVNLVYERALMNSAARKRKQTFVESIANDFVPSYQELEKRVRLIATVIYNTKRKLTVPIPDTFAWANNPHLQITDIRIVQATGGFNSTLKDVTGTVKPEKLLTSNFYVEVSVKKWNGTIAKGQIPSYMLTTDPMAIAQWVRNATRVHATNLHQTKVNTLRAETKELTKQLQNAKRKIEHELAETTLKLQKAETGYVMKPKKKNKPARPQKPVTVETTPEMVTG